MVRNQIYRDIENLLIDSVLVNKFELDDYSEKEIVFLLHLEQYLLSDDRPIQKRPKLHDSFINIYRLAEVVESFGGFEQVKTSKKWKDVASLMGAKQSSVSTFKSLKHSYIRYIEPFLDHIHSTETMTCCHHFNKQLYVNSNKSILYQFLDHSTNSTHSSKSDRNDSKSLPKDRNEKKISVKPSRDIMIYEDISSNSTEAISNEVTFSQGNRVDSDSSSSIHIPETERVIYQVNDMVKVKYARIKKLYDAMIMEVDLEHRPRRYYIHYIGWNNTHDEWIDEVKVRHKIVDIESQPKKKRGRRPKPKPETQPIPIISSPPPKEEPPIVEKRQPHRSTLNSLQDQLFQDAIATSLKEFKQHSVSTESSPFKSCNDTIVQNVFDSQLELDRDISQSIQQIEADLIDETNIELIKSQLSPDYLKIVETESSPSETLYNIYRKQLNEERNNIQQLMNVVFELAKNSNRTDCQNLMIETMNMLKDLMRHYQQKTEYCTNKLSSETQQF